MKKITYRIFISLILLLFFSILYLSVFGIRTDKFNSQIISQVKNINSNLELKLNDISAKLNIFTFTIDAKTYGTNLINNNKIIKLENVKSKISLKSLINNQFAVSRISISTKAISVKELLGFIRSLNKDHKLFIAEKFINEGYVVADLQFNFDKNGKVKNDYRIKGFVNDGKIILLDKRINNLNFFFKVTNNEINFNNIKFNFNDKRLTISKLNALKKANFFAVTGKLNNENTVLKQTDIQNFINNQFIKSHLTQIIFSSDNEFSFEIDRSLRLKNLKIQSNINLYDLKIKNNLEIEKFLPNIKDDILIENQKINLKYTKNNLEIGGSGKIFLQNNPDIIKYKLSQNDNKFIFDINLEISKNPLVLSLIGYEKNLKSNLDLNFKGKIIEKEIFFKEILLNENQNSIHVQNLKLSKNYKINDIGGIDIDYLDKENLSNKMNIKKDKKNYRIIGESFNIDKIVTVLLGNNSKKKQDLFNKDLNLLFDIKKIYLDRDNSIYNLKGSIFLSQNGIADLNLVSNFSNKKKINFTIKTTNNGEKITTLFSNEAKPLVDRYKFIKGFNEGSLDFYSIKKKEKSTSTLKIYDFKLKELPVLTKILTLASLQGIADLLSGEGIRFNEFEMNFDNKDNLMTIKEIYAIGPAISILMEGYIEKDNLISLRGTLVPATTINKTISSIPLLGGILVGKKAGEGVFGVSFKIKGPPGKLETTVNPIKTLTPRFITRTLEKIKKSN